MDTDVEYIDLNNLKLIPTDLNKESQKSEGKSNKFHKIYFQISTNTAFLKKKKKKEKKKKGKRKKKLLLFCEPIPSLKNNQPQTS